MKRMRTTTRSKGEYISLTIGFRVVYVPGKNRAYLPESDSGLNSAL